MSDLRHLYRETLSFFFSPVTSYFPPFSIGFPTPFLVAFLPVNLDDEAELLACVVGRSTQHGRVGHAVVGGAVAYARRREVGGATAKIPASASDAVGLFICRAGDDS